ncbi:DUF1992 domain-containing protein [Nocardioides sp. JQ2195]|uniref:DnaJ family domain-containing protein n=1 Tax=Nocardioides sp. JQ2195 TaxID=2592334 RepID=UPI00143E2B2E|nr:DUF1992 domain-containing protein [Nocardioides sp. JQ2195]QIX25362.1 DUF1992 domain-containing protein [Nocardioides sp. JQ2195]
MPESKDVDEKGPGQKNPGSPDSKAAASARIAQQHLWVDLQVKQAMERGEFDDLPGAGKPIDDLGEHHDPDWWLKKMVEREKISVLPPAMALRKEDLELDALLDRQAGEKQVRDVLEDFNRRIVNARRQLEGGPPVITPTRDVEAEVAAWRDRRTARREAAAARRREADLARPRWWRRRRD